MLTFKNIGEQMSKLRRGSQAHLETISFELGALEVS